MKTQTELSGMETGPQVVTVGAHALLPEEGLTSAEWQKMARAECGISERGFFRERKALQQAKRITKSPNSGKWQPLKNR